MTENERYGGKDYVEKASKGEGKQRAWIAMITKGTMGSFFKNFTNFGSKLI